MILGPFARTPPRATGQLFLGRCKNSASARMRICRRTASSQKLRASRAEKTRGTGGFAARAKHQKDRRRSRPPQRKNQNDRRLRRPKPERPAASRPKPERPAARRPSGRAALSAAAAPRAAARRLARRQRASVGKISAKCCSFSAVSAPIFATKYAFCSIFQNLPDSQAEIFEI